MDDLFTLAIVLFVLFGGPILGAINKAMKRGQQSPKGPTLDQRLEDALRQTRQDNEPRPDRRPPEVTRRAAPPAPAHPPTARPVRAQPATRRRQPATQSRPAQRPQARPSTTPRPVRRPAAPRGPARPPSPQRPRPTATPVRAPATARAQATTSAHELEEAQAYLLKGQQARKQRSSMAQRRSTIAPAAAPPEPSRKSGRGKKLRQMVISAEIFSKPRALRGFANPRPGVGDSGL